MKSLESSLVNWIKGQIELCGANGTVLGLSGGVDSSVAAALLKEANPNVLGVLMPCHSTESDLQDAHLLAKEFDISTKEVSLDGIYDLAVGKLTQALGEQPSKLTLANVKPRLRMLTLYFFANQLNYLVVGTGNRSELEVGYFTKYGDGGVDILPLGNLLKTQVRGLAKHLGVPKSIIGKAPSAGLWEGQTDEDELGVSYEALDNYLADQKPKEANARIEDLRKQGKHKKVPPAVPDF